MIRVLETTSYEEQLRTLILFSKEKRLLRKFMIKSFQLCGGFNVKTLKYIYQ